MKMTKFGHCCFLIEENGVRILTDPGNYYTQQSRVKNIDFVLITHEHADHFHRDSLKDLLQNNPQVKIITNKSVGLLLEKESIPYIAMLKQNCVNQAGDAIGGPRRPPAANRVSEDVGRGTSAAGPAIVKPQFCF